MRRLWILEDNEDLLESAVLLSRRLGYDALSLVSLAEAWRAIDQVARGQARPPAFVISDFHLPDGTSLAWLAEVSRTYGQAEVVCSSACLPFDAEEVLKRLGVLCYPKPMSFLRVLTEWQRASGSSIQA